MVSRYVEAICVLLSDANNSVRAAAMETLVDIYRHVGHKLRTDLSKRSIPAAKTKVLLERFTEVDVSTHNHTTELEVRCIGGRGHMVAGMGVAQCATLDQIQSFTVVYICWFVGLL